MRSYLLAHVNNVTRAAPWLLAILATFYGILQTRLDGFAEYTPLYVQSVLWTADFVLGSLVALRNSVRYYRGIATPEEAANLWSPRLVAWSVCRWAAWMALYVVTFTLRREAGMAGACIATTIESATWLAEGTSCLRNYGILTGAAFATAFAGMGATAQGRLIASAKTHLDELLPEAPEQGQNGAVKH